MASPAGVVRNYYCHSCESEVQINLNDFTCLHCHSGFIEEIRSRSRDDSFTTEPENLLQNLFGDFASVASFNGSDPEDDMATEFEVPRTRRGGRRSGGSRLNPSAERITIRLSSQPNGAPGGVRLASTSNPFLLQLLSGFNSLHGDVRDYTLTQDLFDNVLSFLANQLRVGPPPASEAAIGRLPVSTVTEELLSSHKTCSICFEDYKLSETVTQLPCQHIYHTSCVNTWLKQHATCPICRKDLNGRDTSCMEDVQTTGIDDAAGTSSSS
ncbi:unnamed protein product [Dicrocoelium dendriticum]|nr:unnamed protein product [Dicrocoelium dendriticum]